MCYWALVETGGLLMGDQKNMLLKVPAIGWIMSEPPILSLNGPGLVHCVIKMLH